jgi:hypothetical protein
MMAAARVPGLAADRRGWSRPVIGDQSPAGDPGTFRKPVIVRPDTRSPTGAAS